MVGKPQPALFITAAEQAKAHRPLVVGDRLDTDIEGAVSAGMDSLLVLSGISDRAELLAAPAQQRPTFVAADVTALFEPAEAAGIPIDVREGWNSSAR